MKKILPYSLITGAGFIAYFLIMVVIGQEHNLWLRLFNFVILAAGSFLFMRSLYSNSSTRLGYIQGLQSGMLMCLSSIVVFLIFMGLYIKLFDPSFLSDLEMSMIWGDELTLWQAAFAIGIEGAASSLVVSFTWMQYFKAALENPNLSS